MNCLFFNTRYNLHSVTSNAVARNNIHCIRDYWTDNANNPIDIITLVESFADLLNGASEEIKIRVGSFVTNSPYGTGVIDCDFYYTIKKIAVSNNNWIQITAFDIRNNAVFTKSKLNGTWGSWYQLQPIVRFGDTSPILTPNELLDWARIEFRNGIVCLYARFANYQTQHTFVDGDIIGRLKPEYYPTSGGFPINVHNFANTYDYILWIETDGYIKIYRVGTTTMFYDFYISATYEL